MKKKIGQAILGVVGLFISGSGAMFLLLPARAADKLMLVPDGATGLSHFRAFAGAAVLAVGLSLIIAAVTARLDHARAGALFVLGILAARVISYAVDGPTPEIVLYTAIPSTVFALMLVAHKLIVSEEGHGAGTA